MKSLSLAYCISFKKLTCRTKEDYILERFCNEENRGAFIGFHRVFCIRTGKRTFKYNQILHSVNIIKYFVE